MNTTMSAYSIFDELAETYAPPFFASKEEIAIRMVENACRDKNTSLAQNPGDYKLYFVGSFNCDTGEINTSGNPQFVCHIETLVKGVEENED